MRRSQAPSQLRLKNSAEPRQHVKSVGMEMIEGRDVGAGSQTIERVPLFGFLEIPNNLHRAYVVPQGCVITKRNIELRKTKVLGTGYNKTPFLKPGGMSSFVPVSGMIPLVITDEDEEDDGAEDLPTNFIPPHEPLILWKDPNYVESSGMDTSNASTEDEDEVIVKKQHTVEVIPELCCKLRPHQREGVTFLFECTMGLRGFEGEGCILADDMGLGKTLMSIVLLWTLVNQGVNPAEPNKAACRRVIIACPTSLVGNWDNELKKWIPAQACNSFPVKSEAKATIRNFLNFRGKHAVLIVSYDQLRLNKKMFLPSKVQSMTMGNNGTGCCDLLICDEAHKLKNSESENSRALSCLPAKKRILLSGTPMQNELGEFFNMVNFCNPGVLGTSAEFRKKYERPILESREPDCPRHKKEKAAVLQKELSTTVNEFILKRGNILNAQHLPPKLVQVVCCRLTEEQTRMYDTLIGTKDVRHILQGKQCDSLLYIRHLINICSHPQLIQDTYASKVKAGESDELLQEVVKVADSNTQTNAMTTAQGRYGPITTSASTTTRVDPNRSGKLLVLYRMMLTMRALKNGERIVIVSNYTSTLDLIEAMCMQNQWPCARLDGGTPGPKRTKLVDEFNNVASPGFAFLLSSKAGGCGINLIGGSRLVLFDPDWNPASDKQAAGRIWREGQKRRCYIYRFMSSGSIEEKIIQRQLSKEGLQNVVEDTEQVNEISSKDLKALFVRRDETPSDTHDTLACKRCSTVQSKEGSSASGAVFSESQIQACLEFVEEMYSWLQEQATSIGQSFPPDDIDVLRKGLRPDMTLAQPYADAADVTDVSMSLPPSICIESAYSSVPQFSRAIRRTMHNIQLEQDSFLFAPTAPSSTTIPTDEAINMESAVQVRLVPMGVHVEEEFTQRWIQFVPKLTRLGKEAQKLLHDTCKGKNKGNTTKTGGVLVEEEEEEEEEEDDDDIGYVEQEGCPDDSDFNKWSHHVNVETIDDDVLKRAMAGDDTVSFVFGLEVNWDLLQAKELIERESKELRQLQLQQDLIELNEKRRDKREKEMLVQDEEDQAQAQAQARTDNKKLPDGHPIMTIASELRDKDEFPPKRDNNHLFEDSKKKKKVKTVIIAERKEREGPMDLNHQHHSRASRALGDSLANLAAPVPSSQDVSAAAATATATAIVPDRDDDDDVPEQEAEPFVSPILSIITNVNGNDKDNYGSVQDSTSVSGGRKKTQRQLPNLTSFSGRGGTFAKDVDPAANFSAQHITSVATSTVLNTKPKLIKLKAQKKKKKDNDGDDAVESNIDFVVKKRGASSSASSFSPPSTLPPRPRPRPPAEVFDLLDSPVSGNGHNININISKKLSRASKDKENTPASACKSLSLVNTGKISTSISNFQEYSNNSSGSQGSGAGDADEKMGLWTCFCGFENDDAFDLCCTCETKKPRSKRTRCV